MGKNDFAHDIVICFQHAVDIVPGIILAVGKVLANKHIEQCEELALLPDAY